MVERNVFFMKMEPNTKLFPAVFVEATSKEMLQFELGRTSTTLPLSSAVLLNSGKHLQPQVEKRDEMINFVAETLLMIECFM